MKNKYLILSCVMLSICALLMGCNKKATTFESSDIGEISVEETNEENEYSSEETSEMESELEIDEETLEQEAYYAGMWNYGDDIIYIYYDNYQFATSLELLPYELNEDNSISLLDADGNVVHTLSFNSDGFLHDEEGTLLTFIPADDAV